MQEIHTRKIPAEGTPKSALTEVQTKGLTESSLPSMRTAQSAISMEAATEAAPQCGSFFGGILDRALSLIAADPTRDSLVSVLSRFGVDFFPLVGPLKKYADARELFRTGDKKLAMEGKTLFLIALVEAGVDVAELVAAPGTAGASLLFPDEIFTTLRNLRDTIRRWSGGRISLPDPLSLISRGVLFIPPVSRAVENALSYGMPRVGERSSSSVSA